MKSFAKDILEQKRKRETPLPTKEELLEQAVMELKAMLPKNPQLAEKKKNENPALTDERECMLRAVLANIDRMHPEQDAGFIAHIPDMHLSWSAMATICKNSSLLEVYAKVIADIYKNAHTIEQEHIWLAMDSEPLIKQLSLGGIEWTDYAKRKIERQYPKIYQRLYAPQPPMGFFV